MVFVYGVNVSMSAAACSGHTPDAAFKLLKRTLMDLIQWEPKIDRAKDLLDMLDRNKVLRGHAEEKANLRCLVQVLVCFSNHSCQLPMHCICDLVCEACISIGPIKSKYIV